MSTTVERESIVIELAGHSFTFARPVRKKSRAIVRELLALLRKHPSLESATPNLDTAIDAFAAADDALEFFYAHLPGAKDKADDLDEATEQDIMGALTTFSEFVMRPFKGVPLDTTSLLRPESTS